MRPVAVKVARRQALARCPQLACARCSISPALSAMMGSSAATPSASVCLDRKSVRWYCFPIREVRMTDQPTKDPSAAPPYGLRPETWAAAEFDAIREAINSLLAETMAGIDDCGSWLADHEIAVGAGGNARPNLVRWVRKKLLEYQDLDDRLRGLREAPMALESRSKALETLTPIVRRVVFEQWPTHLDAALFVDGALPAETSAESLAGSERG